MPPLTRTDVEMMIREHRHDGNDAWQVNFPDLFFGELHAPLEYFQVKVFDFGTDVTTGDGKYYIHIPKQLRSAILSEVHAEVITAGTTGTTDIQIANVTQSVDLLSTKLTIDSAETGSDTAATAAVINQVNASIAENDLIRVDVDAVSTTAPKGLMVTLGFRKL
jgi:hypothetical protein